MAENQKAPGPISAPTPAPPAAPAVPGAPGTPPIPPKRSPGHRGADVKDTVAEMAAKAHEISLEAGSKMAAAMKDVINAAAGLTGFVIESARDLVQYMVRRGQMTQEEADKLIREVEAAMPKRKAGTPAHAPPKGAASPPKPPHAPVAHKPVHHTPAAKPHPKPAARKPEPKKKSVAAKPAAKKSAVKKPTPKKAAPKKPAAKKSSPKKSSPKKAAPKKAKRR